MTVQGGVELVHRWGHLRITGWETVVTGIIKSIVLHAVRGLGTKFSSLEFQESWVGHHSEGVANKGTPTNLKTGLEDNLLPLETDVLGPLNEPWRT